MSALEWMWASLLLLQVVALIVFGIAILRIPK